DATKSIAIITNYIVAAIAEGLAERQAEKAEESEETEESNTRDMRFDEGGDEDKDRRRGSGGPAGGKGRSAAGPQKRRIAGPGQGNRGPGGARR
ncbi:MAG: 30S ribosomal protein S2, partial [Ginsengibacter sp.]